MRRAIAKPFHCLLCGKGFARRDNLRYHSQNVHGEGGPVNMNCMVCDKGFTRRDNLNKHLKTLHDQEQYKCDRCNFSCPLKELLKEHIDMEHCTPRRS